MQPDPCHGCVEKQQLESIQRIGRVGYWEYLPQSRHMVLPDVSRQLLHGTLGTASPACQSLMDALSEPERCRFQTALDQAHTRRTAFDLELCLEHGPSKPIHLVVRGAPWTDHRGQEGVAGTFQDITQSKHTEELLTRQRDVMKTIIDNFPGAISLFDADLRMAACNAQFKTVLDFPAHLFDRPQVHFEDLIRFNAQRGEYGPGDAETLTAASLARARNFQAHHMERARPDGRWLEITGTPIPSGGFVTSYIDITERKQAEERIRLLALQDALTGLPNRLALNEQLEQALQRAQASGNRMAVLFLDLDGFKKVNDERGHDVGDALLVGVAQRLRAAVRETDVVARLGGDEFVVLLHDLTDDAMVRTVVDKVVAGVGEPFVLGNAVVQVGTSVGVALCPDHGSTREALLKAADQAMYRVKMGRKGGHALGV